MGISLTEWCVGLVDDLVRLKPKVNSSKSIPRVDLSQSEPWIGAMTMLSEMKEIEGDLLRAWPRKPRIDSAYKKIGSAFQNPLTTEMQFLPDVNNPEQLLFAVVYYQNVCRYESIDRGHRLVAPSVMKQQPMVKLNAIELKRRIDVYCNNADNVKVVNLAFPELSELKGPSLYDNLVEFLAEKTIEEKLISEFETDADAIIKNHNGPSATLFLKLDTTLSTKERTLRKIAAYKKLIELLDTNTITPQDLHDADKMQKMLPLIAKELSDLNKTIPEPNFGEKWVVNTERAAIRLATLPAQLTNLALRYTVGWIAPKVMRDVASDIASKVSSVAELVTPDSMMERKKSLLMTAAHEKISSLASKLNSRGSVQMTGLDFKTMSSDEATQLADKVATIRHMVHLQKSLMQYRREHHSGIVKYSLSSLFYGVTRILSMSFLRPLIFDKVLLTLEAEKLEKTLDHLIHQTENATAFDKVSVKKELLDHLDRAKNTTKEISVKSRYIFFKDESKKASTELKDIIGAANFSIKQK